MSLRRLVLVAAPAVIAPVVLMAAAALVAVAGCGAQAQARPAEARPKLPTARSPFVVDLTWVSARQGWILAAVPCGSALCPRLSRTDDGGRTWTPLPHPPGTIQWEGATADCSRVACISHIRFASAAVGYLFGPALFQTNNGGRTWRRVASLPVEALETADGTVDRVVYDHEGCPGPCERTVQEAAVGSSSWRTLLRIPQASGVLAQLIRQGPSVIYIAVYGNLASGAGSQHTIIFRSTDGGASWQILSDPCGTGHDAVGLATATGGFLAALCIPRSGSGPAFVLTSADFGARWGPHRAIPATDGNFLDMVAAASDTDLAVGTGAVYGSGPLAYRLVTSTDAGRHWSTAVSGTAQIKPDEPGVAWLDFEDPEVGHWISDPRTMWSTDDGGARWVRLAFR